MTYEEFISDLPLEDTIVFNSAEENEETMQRLGVNQQIRQLGKGDFQAHSKGGSVVGISTLMGFLVAIFFKTLEE